MLESVFLFGLLFSLCLPRDDAVGRPLSTLVAENRFLRTQLALFVSRRAKPRRPSPGERIEMAFWSMMFDWRDSLVVVKPDTLIRWQRKLVRLDWAWISKVWTRRASARRATLCLAGPVRARKAPSTLRAPPGAALDRIAKFAAPLTTTTLGFKRLYVFVLMDLGTRRILHLNVTAHPTAAWTTQQLRDAIPDDHRWRFLIHDRDAIFSASVDETLKSFGIRPLKSPPRTPKANAFCERLIGTTRRECLDHIIPLGETHLRRILGEWKTYYNECRPHMGLGNLPPAPPEGVPVPLREHRHDLPDNARIESREFLGGLHHDYRLVA